MGYDSSKADSFLSNMTLSLFRLELGSYFTILSLDIESYIRTCTLIFHFQEGDMAFVPTTSVLRNETLCLIIRYIFSYEVYVMSMRVEKEVKFLFFEYKLVKYRKKGLHWYLLLAWVWKYRSSTIIVLSSFGKYISYNYCIVCDAKSSCCNIQLPDKFSTVSYK